MIELKQRLRSGSPGARHRLASRPLLVLLVLLLAGCTLPSATAGLGRTPGSTLPTATPAAFLPTATPTARPTLAASPTPTAASAPSPAPADLHLDAGDIRFYPDPELFSGDLVTMEITPQNVGSIDPSTIAVEVTHDTDDGNKPFAEERVNVFGFDGVPRIRLIWAWSTDGLAGPQTLVFHLDPDDEIHEGDEDPSNNVVTLTVQLRPAGERHPEELAAVWETTTTDCCVLHYMSGTSAERDLSEITAMAERAVDHAEEQLGAEMAEPLDIYLPGRVIGHGGYAYQEIAISYLDRHYAAFDIETGIRHEATHVLDTQLLTGRAPALLREGLAVWVAGGHFKPEPIPQRAAALFELDRFVPLGELGDEFYRQQHEIGYLEGAALVDYLVDTYGWDSFVQFYRSFETVSEGSQTADLEAALVQHYGLDLAATEAEWIRWLQSHPPTPNQVRDLQDTIDLFDTIRRYQQEHDPTAYFRSGWLVNPTTAEERGIVADLLRHPREPQNIALETMLIAAHEALRGEEYERAENLLEGIHRALEEDAFTRSPEGDYLAIVERLAAAGYEAQRIDLEQDRASVQAIARWPILEELTLQRVTSGWELVQEEGGGRNLD